MKLIIRVLAVVLSIILLSMVFANKTSVAQAPTKSNEEIIDESERYKITEDGAVEPLSAAYASGNNKPPSRTTSPLPGMRGQSGRDYSGSTYSKDQVIQLIHDYSAKYGINPEVPLCIAKWESGYNQLAKNQSSSASGVFQYLKSTWAGTDEGKLGLSVFDADANVKAAIKYMASRRNTLPWVVWPKCPQL